MSLQENIAGVRARIAAAARDAGEVVLYELQENP